MLQTIIGGPLAAPWGVALAPASFGEFGGDLLVGNFSFVESEINAFDPTTGAFRGTIPVDPGSGNTPGGLWSLQFGIGGMNGAPNTLYFTDGVDGEMHGLFAALSVAAVPEPSTLALLGAGLLSLCALRCGIGLLRRSASESGRLRQGPQATCGAPAAGVCLVVLSAAALSLSASATYATPIEFVAVLSPANEIPPTASSGTGLAKVFLDPAAHTIQVNVTFSVLTTNDVAALIHCCLPSPFFPMNVGVATTLPAFPGFPLGVTSGTYSSALLSLTDSGTYNPAFVMAQGGIGNAEAALVAGIENGETYLNIHSVMFGDGEIRGFLVAPEPGALVLLGVGLLALAGIEWRRHRRT